MTAWVGDWLRAFGVTTAAEMIVVVPLLRAHEKAIGRRVSAVVLANLASHPLVWFVFPAIALGYAARLGVSEAFAVAVETLAYVVIWSGLGWGRATLVSLVANAASLVVGLVLRATHLLA